jgi:hypothetical protein
MTRAWSDAAEAKLERLYRAGTPLSQLAFLLKRTQKAVKSRANVLKLQRDDRPSPWGSRDDAKLRRLWPTSTAREIGEALGRGVPAIYQRAHKLGLPAKDAAWAAECTRKRWAEGRHESARAHQFRPGQAPPNKGLRRPGWARGRMAETQFKKGDRLGASQHNYRPIGTLRISKDGYLERKVTDDPSLVPARRWTGVHRLVWEAANGPVPEGYVVCFLPGRRTTDEAAITLDALELVSRVELMRRNTLHRYPPEVVQLVQLRAAVVRKINRRSKA